MTFHALGGLHSQRTQDTDRIEPAAIDVMRRMIRAGGGACPVVGRVTIQLNPDGTATLTAVHHQTGERHVATAPGDGYAAACLLAQSVGIDLE